MNTPEVAAGNMAHGLVRDLVKTYELGVIKW